MEPRPNTNSTLQPSPYVPSSRNMGSGKTSSNSPSAMMVSSAEREKGSRVERSSQHPHGAPLMTASPTSHAHSPPVSSNSSRNNMTMGMGINIGMSNVTGGPSHGGKSRNNPSPNRTNSDMMPNSSSGGGPSSSSAAEGGNNNDDVAPPRMLFFPSPSQQHGRNHPNDSYSHHRPQQQSQQAHHHRHPHHHSNLPPPQQTPSKNNPADNKTNNKESMSADGSGHPQRRNDNDGLSQQSHLSSQKMNDHPSSSTSSPSQGRHRMSMQGPGGGEGHHRDSYRPTSSSGGGGGGGSAGPYSSLQHGGPPNDRGQPPRGNYGYNENHSYGHHSNSSRHPPSSSRDEYYDSSSHHSGHMSNPSSMSEGNTSRDTGRGSYPPMQGMQASRLAYEQDTNPGGNAVGPFSSNNPPPTPTANSSSYNNRYSNSNSGNNSMMNNRNKEDPMGHYHPPQASPQSLDMYGNASGGGGSSSRNRYEMTDHGGHHARSGGRQSLMEMRNSGSGSTDGADHPGGGHGMDDFDAGHGGGFYVSPAVASNRRGKRSPYDPDHMFPSDRHASPPQRSSTAVRYCTPIVTGNRSGDNVNFTGGPQDGDRLHLSGGKMNKNNSGPDNRPSPPRSRYDEGQYDSHLRHYHRPYPLSPNRYHESPEHHHHNASPTHYATPVLPRNPGNQMQGRMRDRSYFEGSYHHPPSSYHHNQHNRNEKENYPYAPNSQPPPYGHPNAPPGGYYSPYGDTRHMDYRSTANLPPQPMPPVEVQPPPQKKRRNNDKAKNKAPSNKPPRRKKMYSDYVGVTYNKTHAKFQACITHYRKQHYLGRYKLAVEAARAYDKSAKELKGDGWKINFQSDEEFEAAKLKEIADNEKKKIAAAQLKAAQEESERIAASAPPAASNVSKSESDPSASASKPNDKDVKSEPKVKLEQEDNDQKPSSLTSVSQSTMSAVTPSPHAQNLNKRDASLMNEPLMSPDAKTPTSSTLQSSMLSPTPLKPIMKSSNAASALAFKDPLSSKKDGPPDLTMISNNIFSSPLEKTDNSGETLHEGTTDLECEQQDSSSSTAKKEEKGEEAEDAAQALIMIGK